MLRSQVKIVACAFGALAFQALIAVLVEIRAEVTLSILGVLLRHAFCAIVLGGALNAVRVVCAAERANIGVINEILGNAGFASLEVAFDAVEVKHTAARASIAFKEIPLHASIADVDCLAGSAGLVKGCAFYAKVLIGLIITVDTGVANEVGAVLVAIGTALLEL